VPAKEGALELKEKDRDKVFFQQQQAQAKEWVVEEQQKAAEVAQRASRINAQRRQQLVEKDMISHREKSENYNYEIELLKGIQRDMLMDREKELAKKREDAPGLYCRQTSPRTSLHDPP